MFLFYLSQTNRNQSHEICYICDFWIYFPVIKKFLLPPRKSVERVVSAKYGSSWDFLVSRWGWGKVLAYKWCGFHVVERAFPSVFLLTSDKDVCLADNVSGADIFLFFWDGGLIMNVQDWKVERLINLLNMLYGIRSVGEQYTLGWVEDKKRRFDLKSYYGAFVVNMRTFPWNDI